MHVCMCVCMKVYVYIEIEISDRDGKRKRCVITNKEYQCSVQMDRIHLALLRLLILAYELMDSTNEKQNMNDIEMERNIYVC